MHTNEGLAGLVRTESGLALACQSGSGAGEQGCVTTRNGEPPGAELNSQRASYQGDDIIDLYNLQTPLPGHLLEVVDLVRGMFGGCTWDYGWMASLPGLTGSELLYGPFWPSPPRFNRLDKRSHFNRKRRGGVLPHPALFD